MPAGHGNAHRHARIDELHRHVGRGAAEFLAVAVLERGGQRGAGDGIVGVGAGRQRYDKVEALADKAAVGKPLDAQPVELQPGFGDDCARFVLEPAERGLEPGELVTIEAKADRRHAVDAGRRDQQAQAEATPGDGGQTSRVMPSLRATQ